MPKFLWDFEIQTDHIIPARRPDPAQQQKEKKKLRTCFLVAFDVSANQREKIKENEKIDKYSNLA